MNQRIQTQGRREHEIWQACDTLWREGLTPKEITGDRIRDKLIEHGLPKGGNTELYRYRKTWLTYNGLSDEADQPLDRLSDPLSHAVSLLQQQIRKELQAEYDTLKQEAEAQVKAAIEQLRNCQLEQEQVLGQWQQLNDEFNQLTENYQQVSRQLGELKEQHAVSEAERNHLEKQLIQQQAAMEQALKAQQQGYEATIHMLEKQAAKLEQQLQQTNDDWKERFETYRHQTIVEADNYKTTISKLQQQKQSTEHQLAQAQVENSQLKESLKDASLHLVTSHAKQDELNHVLQQKERELREQEHYTTLLNHQQKHLQQQYIELKHQNQQLEQTLVEIKQQLQPPLRKRKRE